MIHSLIQHPKRWTAADYDKAIQDLQDAKTQLEPDAKPCAVCGDSGHMAWECHHNPLAMMHEAQKLQNQWRCFHCGAVFTDEGEAQAHFGDPTKYRLLKRPMCRSAKRKINVVVVEGKGTFPMDMLRYDAATPYKEEDSGRLHHPYVNISTRRVSLLMHREPSVERWQSFGWDIVEIRRIG